MVVIMIVGTGDGSPTPYIGTYVKSFDPDARNGIGELKVTVDREKAKTFSTATEALACWKLQSKVKPYRLDGKPNRPLTAYTVELVTVPH